MLCVSTALFSGASSIECEISTHKSCGQGFGAEVCGSSGTETCMGGTCKCISGFCAVQNDSMHFECIRPPISPNTRSVAESRIRLPACRVELQIPCTKVSERDSCSWYGGSICMNGFCQCKPSFCARRGVLRLGSTCQQQTSRSFASLSTASDRSAESMVGILAWLAIALPLAMAFMQCGRLPRPLESPLLR